MTIAALNIAAPSGRAHAWLSLRIVPPPAPPGADRGAERAIAILEQREDGTSRRVDVAARAIGSGGSATPEA
jgi:hypothetical protein